MTNSPWEIHETRYERAVDFLMFKVVCFPLHVCDKSPRRSVRVFGLLWHLVWFFPVMTLCCVPLMLLMWADIFAQAWSGHD